MPYKCQYSAKEPKSTDYSARLTFEAYERKIYKFDEIHERQRAARYAEAERRTRTELSLSSQLLLTNLTYLLGLLTNNNLPFVLTILLTNLTCNICLQILAYLADMLGLCTNNCLPFCLPILLATSAYQDCLFALLSYKHRLGSKRE